MKNPAKPTTLSEDYYYVTEYMATLEQILQSIAEELEVLPNAGYSEAMQEILEKLKGTIIDGQIKRRAFEFRLKRETK